GTLESTFAGLWVSGEVSEVSRPHSGHVYFTLKDEHAQIRAVLWRSTAQRQKFQLQEGQEVICRGDLDVYPPRGSYQLVVRTVEPRGVGALQLAFKQLQEKLAKEGLFDPAHKQPLPPYPRRIAFVTSPTGAAIRDFLEIARRRHAGVHVLIIPARVQGDCAADDIVRGIQQAHRLIPRPDVIVVGRGGGSVEDLWCFNEEKVVRAIFAAEIPVVSAVGHEIDVTLSDLAADVRAATPSEAAERIVPSAEELLLRLAQYQKRLVSALRGQCITARSRLDSLAARRVLKRPLDRLGDLSRQLDELQVCLVRAMRRRVTRAHDRLKGTAACLESLSPLAILSRGYSITQRAADGRIVRSADDVQAGDLIATRLHQGSLISRVENGERGA
ncbi:MAG TPA: exodeoxyribonuclease VII large subunit, partial [Pirellulaceae bacterium]|nr:exodeoxyribonuclease VII large subunit [Pirellulaceae bacterium]